MVSAKKGGVVRKLGRQARGGNEKCPGGCFCVHLLYKALGDTLTTDDSQSGKEEKKRCLLLATAPGKVAPGTKVQKKKAQLAL